MGIGKGEYQTSLQPPPKKIVLHCQEIDKFHNKIDSQPSTHLFSVDVKNGEVHSTLPPTYLPLSSSNIHSLHLTLLDKRHQEAAPKNVLIWCF